MKYLCVLLTILIAFTAINSSKITYKLRSKGAWGNLWCFAVGSIGTFIGQRDMDPENVLDPIKSCIPKEWGGSESNENDENSSFKHLQNNNSVVKKILDMKFKWCPLGMCVINFSTDTLVEKICQYAKFVIKALGGRRFRRVFLHTSSRTRLHIIKRAILIEFNRAHLKMKWSLKAKISEAASSLVRPIIDKFRSFVTNLIERIPICKKIIETFQCLKGLAEGIADTVKSRVLGLMNAIKNLLKGWVGFVGVIIRTVCAWQIFKQALKDLIDAFANTGCKKWKLIGNFAGGLLGAIADGNK